jgi:ring-1,2-phenylacetyl-CoA epoxidase subunit PaaD
MRAAPATPDAQRREEVFEVLRGVLDPEVPAVSVVDLGIVRDVELDAAGVPTVVVTPTYSGCPAVKVIEEAIVDALELRGFAGARVRTVFAPAWTTDWMSDEAREKLRRYGIAPPGRRAASEESELVPLTRRVARVECPFCGSTKTTVRSDFGSTACKALMYCDACRQPFELFKAI